MSNSPATLLQQLNADMASVVEEVRRSLVQVSVGIGNGAGTIWHSDGLIVTNAHVVSHAGSRRRRGYGYGYAEQVNNALTVTLPDGRTLPARVIAQDDERDVAALAVDANNLPTIQIGDSRELRPGQWVYAVGHPWGVTGAASAGIVVGSGSEWPEMPTNGRDWIVISLKVRPGNSGGPLVDVQGRLLGINTLMTGPQVGAAIPVHTIKTFLKETLGTSTADLLVQTL
ncbi:MAG: trypsin-like peptidase domain-containing protein [Chloroflexota bacterium]